jgi:hypothetical protein
MNNIQVRNRTFEGLAWSAFVIWWRIAELFQFLPSATWVFGVGLILIALNVARVLKGLPTSGFTITVGILALVWGGLETAGLFLNLPFELPVFPIMLIVLGVIVLAGNLTEKEAKRAGGLKWLNRL